MDAKTAITLQQKARKVRGGGGAYKATKVPWISSVQISYEKTTPTGLLITLYGQGLRSIKPPYQNGQRIVSFALGNLPFYGFLAGGWTDNRLTIRVPYAVWQQMPGGIQGPYKITCVSRGPLLSQLLPKDWPKVCVASNVIPGVFKVGGSYAGGGTQDPRFLGPR